MKMNRVIALAALLIMLFAMGCSKTDPDRKPEKEKNPDLEGSSMTNSNIKLEGNEVIFRGKITEIQKNEIHMEIVESDIAFGLYRVLVQSSTPFYDKDGKEITKDDLKAGDKIDVVFAGQVMQSYPPQIAAIRVYLAE